MEQLICHLAGDYIIQNDWMANNKTKSSVAAAIHAVTYSLPFLLLTRSPEALAVICGTHFVIDRWRLASWWVKFWGVGCSGYLWKALQVDRMPWETGWSERMNERWEQKPDWLFVWLLILVDNTIHLTVNHLSLKYLTC